ncbi:MAG: aminotransferase class V-fold PLP-dependent enzyme [Oscillospiraceae bacterium]|nr:aminotransferase class V-fold PLP-dependent enzyme [Oscillospiraceae bacterium]
MENLIYLDNAATTLKKPPAVVQAVASALSCVGNAARGGHAGALAAARTVYDARVKLAELFHCPRPDHVVFTSNATEALNIALFGLLGPGDHVISTDLEHNSVLRPLYALEEAGTALSFVPADRLGRIDCSRFEDLIRPNTRAIVCTHASNLTGNPVDLARVGRIARDHGLFFIVDAAQSAGAMPIDMEEMHIDVLCFTGHKGLMGPQGTGGLCIREGVEIRPFKRGGSGVHSYDPHQPAQYPTRLEAGTLNCHGIAGLSAALDCIKAVGVEAIAAHEERLTRRFYEGVRQIDGVRVYGDLTFPRAAIVALNIRDYDSSAVSDALSENWGIATRPGAHCAPRMHRALGTEEQGAVRFSFSLFTTEEEVDAAILAVKTLAE